MSTKHRMHKRGKSPSRIVFVVFNTIVMIAFAFVCLAPFVNLLAISLSDSLPAVSGQVGFFPLNSEGKFGINLDAYRYLFRKSDFFKAFGISVARVVLGVLISVTVQILAAYPMARGDRFKGRKFFVVFYTVTMFFSGGLIPTYLVITGLGLYDNILALILPTAANAWNMVLFINFFKQIPKELEEYAYLEGMNPFATLIKIVIPLSLPVIATVVLFTAVAHWNSWFDGFIYMEKENYPLQTYIYNMIDEFTTLSKSDDPAMQELVKNLPGKTLRSAQIFVAMLPIMCVYPFVQKFFIKGLTLGAVKQ